MKKKDKCRIWSRWIIGVMMCAVLLPVQVSAGDSTKEAMDIKKVSYRSTMVNESGNPMNVMKVINNETYPTELVVPVKNLNTEGAFHAECRGLKSTFDEVSYMTTNTPVILRISLKVNSTDWISYNGIHVDRMTITFPDILQFKEGQEGVNGQTLTISNVDFSGDTYVKDLYITGYHFGSAPGEGIKPVEENGESVIKVEQEQITMGADVTVSGVAGTGSLSIMSNITVFSMPCDKIAGYEKVNTALDIPSSPKAYIPVTGAIPATSIPEGDYYNGGNIDWSPKNLANGRFTGNTEYTAKFTLETKRTGESDSKIDYLYPENFQFHLEGSQCSTEVSKDGTSATVTAVFPATREAISYKLKKGADGTYTKKRERIPWRWMEILLNSKVYQ